MLVVAGREKHLLHIVNAHYLFAARSELQEKAWVHFDLDLHADFQRQWGRIPEQFNKIRVLFEVRYDEKKAGDREGKANVYYDDLYLGE